VSYSLCVCAWCVPDVQVPVAAGGPVGGLRGQARAALQQHPQDRQRVRHRREGEGEDDDDDGGGRTTTAVVSTTRISQSTQQPS
jgi:hypothetical protein